MMQVGAPMTWHLPTEQKRDRGSVKLVIGRRLACHHEAPEATLHTYSRKV